MLYCCRRLAKLLFSRRGIVQPTAAAGSVETPTTVGASELELLEPESPPSIVSKKSTRSKRSSSWTLPFERMPFVSDGVACREGMGGTAALTDGAIDLARALNPVMATFGALCKFARAS